MGEEMSILSTFRTLSLWGSKRINKDYLEGMLDRYLSLDLDTKDLMTNSHQFHNLCSDFSYEEREYLSRRIKEKSQLIKEAYGDEFYYVQYSLKCLSERVL